MASIRELDLKMNKIKQELKLAIDNSSGAVDTLIVQRQAVGMKQWALDFQAFYIAESKSRITHRSKIISKGEKIVREAMNCYYYLIELEMESNNPPAPAIGRTEIAGLPSGHVHGPLKTQVLTQVSDLLEMMRNYKLFFMRT